MIDVMHMKKLNLNSEK